MIDFVFISGGIKEITPTVEEIDLFYFIEGGNEDLSGITPSADSVN